MRKRRYQTTDVDRNRRSKSSPPHSSRDENTNMEDVEAAGGGEAQAGIVQKLDQSMGQGNEVDGIMHTEL